MEKSLYHIGADIAAAANPNKSTGCKISVIVPCHNSAKFLRPCLESLARQTLQQNMFEVICVDDCSDDDTVALIESYSAQIRNLRVIRHSENKKQGAARNSGLDNAQGEFITFIDSDDFLRTDALETLLYAAMDGSDVVVAQLLRVRYDTPYSSKPTARKMRGDPQTATAENSLGWFPCSLLISRKLLEEYNIRFQEHVYFEDIEFCVRLFLKCKKCIVIKDPIYYYIQRDQSTVNLMTEKKIEDSAAAMARVFNVLQDRPDLTKIFTKTAKSWLQLQASRIRDSDAPIVKRREHAMHLIAELKRRGVTDQIGASSNEELLKIATSEPQIPKSSFAAGTVTSSSPWGGKLEAEFAGKVIFFCEVDYHIRGAANVVRALKRYGVESIIVDASRSTSFSSNRPLADHELKEYSDLDIREFNVAKHLPFSTDASAFVFMNDLTYTKRLILENFGFGVPTFGLYEGINDDWNLDRIASHQPYRSVDCLLLPGIYQAGFYQDREYRIVGLPNIYSRWTADYIPPKKRRAIINVNFTYGVLEDRRDEYVESAVQACKELELPYVITQHPADKADLSRFNVGKEKVYDLLEEGTILISRFSTTMLESLAMGRPIVYHNPIKEKVPKFFNPLGAYSVSHDTETLKHALQRELDFLDRGGNVRERAELFLHFHCNISSKHDPAELSARSIAGYLANPKPRFSFKTGMEYQQKPIVPNLIKALAKFDEDITEEPVITLDVQMQAPETRVFAEPDDNVKNSASQFKSEKTQNAGNKIELDQLSTELLLDPNAGLRRIQSDPELQKIIAELEHENTDSSPIKQHLKRVLMFVRDKV